MYQISLTNCCSYSRIYFPQRPIPSLFNAPWYQNAKGAYDEAIHLTSLLNASEVVASARARLADTSNSTSANSPLNSTVPVPPAITSPQVRGSISGTSHKRSAFRILHLIFVQGLILTVM
ncbi:hypothetical protein PGTUg99_029417 [Puccinia graminis f. sp. tritici]|uniref:Uncharacterized protein n=1 Tax=Puccinia graminis f. sp. tritici TaxID=56615 RepID=A0A5B0MZL3_PUCGR|nr:hypothetical protein PGTUg99_029417 [Puccinia graminis f. sp. tritici]